MRRLVGVLSSFGQVHRNSIMGCQLRVCACFDCCGLVEVGIVGACSDRGWAVPPDGAITQGKAMIIFDVGACTGEWNSSLGFRGKDGG